MFVSANEAFNYICNGGGISGVPSIDPQLSPKQNKNQISKALKQIYTDIADRKSTSGDIYIGKWMRPWEIVPSLVPEQIPKDDALIGIEIELDFVNSVASMLAVQKIKNWRHIAIDLEGGKYPCEVTFPPILLSNFKKSKALKYLQYLRKNDNLVKKHNPKDTVGTHVNVSLFTDRLSTHEEIDNRRAEINSILYKLSKAQKWRYFGRNPYGYGYTRYSENNSFIEWKLFNSVLSGERLETYVNIAVELTKLVYEKPADNKAPLKQRVLNALEKGFAKPVTTKD